MKTTSDPAAPNLVITRIFNAPRELVFKVWTYPKHVMRWWGPGGFTSPFCKIDLRPGGAFHFCMRAPDGKDYWNKGIYDEIVAPEKIVSRMYFSDKDGNICKPSDYGIGQDFPTEMLDTVTFEVHEGNKTKLTLHRNTALAISKKYMEDQGWNQSLDKFAAAVANAEKNGDNSSTSDREIVSTRVFDAPREMVWKAWTQPEHLAKWWGPKGFKNTFHEFDLRPGGVWSYVMHGPDGKDYQNKTVFVEIVKPERIVVDHTSSPQFRITATFEDVGGKTKIVFRQLFESAAVCNQIKGIAVPGNEQNFDKLAAHLATMR